MAIPGVGERREILACAETTVTQRRQSEVDDLLVLLAWADSHSGDPQEEPHPVSARLGGPRLVSVGGEGTPQVVDLCFAEIAIARSAGEVATRNLTGDALDLRHRLPTLWQHVLDLACEAWVARKIARMSRALSRETAQVVDRAVADAIGQAPSRLLAIAEAKIIEADQAAHEARIRENQARRGVWFSTPQIGDLVDETDHTAGIRALAGRLDEAAAVDLDQTLDDLAALLDAHGDPDEQAADGGRTWDQLRADALGLLARPADALALMREDDATQSPVPRRAARLVVHLTDATVAETKPGIARAEGLGPMLLSQLSALLGHRRVEVLPVIDLRQIRSVNGYEHPTDIRTRTHVRTGGDVFPHSASPPHARVDHDHCAPYNKAGPPGQTGDLNDAPLTRRAHRAKTHLGYRVDQLAPGAYRWRTPHGLARLVTPRGTRAIELITASDGTILGEFYPRSVLPSVTLRLDD